MNFFEHNAPPSLTTLASNAVALSLWNSQKAFVAVQRSCRNSMTCDECHFVVELTRFLRLPKKLKSLTRFSVLRLGSYINHWMKSFSLETSLHCFREMKRFYQRICWTPHGTVDAVRTARRLASNSRSDINFRYRLSCCFSQEDLIDSLWNQMSDRCRLVEFELVSEENFYFCASAFWTAYKRGNLRQIMTTLDSPTSIFRLGYEVCNNQTSKEFFWDRLTEAEKTKLMMNVSNWKDIDSLFIKKVGKDVLDDLYWIHGHFDLLFPLLVGGHYDAFGQAIECYGDYLTEDDFFDILYNLSAGAPWLIAKIWLKATVTMRKLFWDGDSLFNQVSILLNLFAVSDRDTVEDILMYASDEQLINLFVPDMSYVLTIPRLLIRWGNWRMLKCFGEELIKTKDIMNRVRAALTPQYLKGDRHDINLKTLQNWLVIVEPQFFRHVSTLLDIRPEKSYLP